MRQTIEALCQELRLPSIAQLMSTVEAPTKEEWLHQQENLGN